MTLEDAEKRIERLESIVAMQTAEITLLRGRLASSRLVGLPSNLSGEPIFSLPEASFTPFDPRQYPPMCETKTS